MSTVSRTDSDSSTANQTAYTFTTSIGANGGTDILYVAPAGRSVADATGISSVTMDGVAASSIVQRSATEGGGVTCVIGLFALARSSLPDPSQTDMDVVVTFNAAMIRAAMDTFVGIGSQATAHATANDGQDTCTSGSATLDLDLNVPDQGIVISAATTAEPDATWSWVGLTEQSDYAFENNRYGSAMLSNGSAETARDISATTTQECCPVAVAASFAAAGAPEGQPAGKRWGGVQHMASFNRYQGGRAW